MRKYIGTILLLISVLLQTSSPCAQIQPEVFTRSAFSPVGSGARAAGMGDAFIGVADDATAASWNPAGLAQLKRYEVSIAINSLSRQDSSTFDSYPEASDRIRITRSHLNYFSMVYPHKVLGRNIILSLNYQHLYDMNIRYCRRWHYIVKQKDLPSTWELDINWDYQKKGGLSALSPAFAIQLSPSLSLGMSINLWPRDALVCDNGWTKTFSYTLKGNVKNNLQNIPFESIRNNQYRYTFSGTNLHLGFLWKVNRVVNLGGVYKTPFSARLNCRISELEINTDDYEYNEYSERQSLKMPPSYGLGISARLSDNLTLALDIYGTDWQRFTLQTKRGVISPITDYYPQYSKLDPTYHIRMGIEHLFITSRRIFAIRSGISYDPDPSTENAQDYYGLSLGTGVAFKNTAIDIAYKFRFARDLHTISFQGEWDHSDIYQHFLYLSMIQYF